MEYLPRLADPTLIRRLEDRAAVMINGPRACGKTTSALQVARGVVRLDVPAEAILFRADPDAALAAFVERPLLLDEWQEVPELIGAVKRSVDGGAPPGSFVLTGSVRAAVEGETWPGTGRIATIEMCPLALRERSGAPGARGFIGRLIDGAFPAGSVPEAPDVVGYVDLALAGGFPEPALVLPERERGDWYLEYVEQIAARDVVGILRRADPDRVRTYIEACALNSAAVVEHKTIYDAAGIARKTAEGYDDVLRRLFVAVLVPAWSTSRLSSLGSLPKRYVADPALLAAAARIDRDDILRDGDLLGRLIDTFVLAQLRAEVMTEHPGVRIHHLRTDGGRQEIDLLLALGGRRVAAIEIKAGAAPSRDDARHLRWLRDRLGDDFVAGVVLHTGPSVLALDDRIVALPICTLWT